MVRERPAKARNHGQAKTDPVVQPAGDETVVRGNPTVGVVDPGGAGGGSECADGGDTGNPKR